jgi:hypothetical protein
VLAVIVPDVIARNLVWHRGKHHSKEHDGYPRHAHSYNGLLTIVSDDPHPHFQGGPPFTTPKSRARMVTEQRAIELLRQRFEMQGAQQRAVRRYYEERLRDMHALTQ